MCMQASPEIRVMSTSLGDVLERIRERGPQLRAVMAVEKRWHLANFYTTSGEQYESGELHWSVPSVVLGCCCC